MIQKIIASGCQFVPFDNDVRDGCLSIGLRRYGPSTFLDFEILGLRRLKVSTFWAFGVMDLQDFGQLGLRPFWNLN